MRMVTSQGTRTKLRPGRSTQCGFDKLVAVTETTSGTQLTKENLASLKLATKFSRLLRKLFLAFKVKHGAFLSKSCYRPVYTGRSPG